MYKRYCLPVAELKTLATDSPSCWIKDGYWKAPRKVQDSHPVTHPGFLLPVCMQAAPETHSQSALAKSSESALAYHFLVGPKNFESSKGHRISAFTVAKCCGRFPQFPTLRSKLGNGGTVQLVAPQTSAPGRPVILQWHRPQRSGWGFLRISG